MIRLRLEMYPKAAAWIERPFILRSKRSGLGSRLDDGSRALFTSQKGALSREQVHRIFKGIAERAGVLKGKRCVHILSIAEPVTWSTRA